MNHGHTIFIVIQALTDDFVNIWNKKFVIVISPKSQYANTQEKLIKSPKF